MAYEFAPIDAALTAAYSDDPALMADLRRTVLHSAHEHVQALAQSASAPEWHRAAWRFKGLCVTFGLAQLIDLAERATVAPKGDPGLLRKLQAVLKALSEEG
ncbi:MAG TPA: Hpt domain-containing protein [Sphingobium sp.]|uniref:Hpt domain-containing protein n=1 Tax=Sphingobium sp. TaxID=1912891 RepID=UPI002ED2DD23